MLRTLSRRFRVIISEPERTPYLWQVEYTVFRDTRNGSYVSADVVDGSDYYKDERIPENLVS